MLKQIISIAQFLLICCFSPALQAQTPYGDNPAAGHYAQVNGIKLYYEVYGEGPTMVFLHGNGGSIGVNADMIERFSKKHKVVAIDSRCHGKSGCSSGDLNYEMMAADVNALLEQLHEDSCLVYGHSDGGIIGLILASRYPNKVGRLLTLGANLTPDTLAVFPYLVELVNQYPGVPDTMERKHLKLMADHPHIGPADLKKISAPVLVMAGDRDAIREEHTLKIFQSLPNAQLCILPGTTHLGPWEKPDLFFLIASDFFEKPFEKPSFIDMVRQAVETQQQAGEKKD